MEVYLHIAITVISKTHVRIEVTDPRADIERSRVRFVQTEFVFADAERHVEILEFLLEVRGGYRQNP